MPHFPHLFSTLIWFSALTACAGDDATGPGGDPPSFENVDGQWVGTSHGVTQGASVDAIIGLTLAQSGDTLSGFWQVHLTVDRGFVVTDLWAGNLTGTIALGQNPFISFAVRNFACPNYRVTFSGSLNSASNQITLNGQIAFFTASCEVELAYSATILLSRK